MNCMWMVVVGEHHDDLQQRRKEMKTEEFKERMHQRNGIEGTVSEFTRGGGRRTRYRGLAKTTLANYFRGAAVNANRWIRLNQWQQQQQGKKKGCIGAPFRPLRSSISRDSAFSAVESGTKRVRLRPSTKRPRKILSRHAALVPPHACRASPKRGVFQQNPT